MSAARPAFVCLFEGRPGCAPTLRANREEHIISSRFQTTFGDIVCTVERERSAEPHRQEDDEGASLAFDITIDLADLAAGSLDATEEPSCTEGPKRTTSIDAGEFICLQDRDSLSIGIRSPKSGGEDAPIDMLESWIRISWKEGEDGSADLVVDVSSSSDGSGPVPFSQPIAS
jgi:hypothetical protein